MDFESKIIHLDKCLNAWTYETKRMEYIGKIFISGRNQDMSGRQCFVRDLSDYLNISYDIISRKGRNLMLDSHLSSVVN